MAHSATTNWSARGSAPVAARATAMSVHTRAIVPMTSRTRPKGSSVQRSARLRPGALLRFEDASFKPSRLRIASRQGKRRPTLSVDFRFKEGLNPPWTLPASDNPVEAFLMFLPVSRRTFLGASGLAAATVALPSASAAIIRRGAARPAAVSSSNGLAAVNRAMELVLGGTDTLDAAVEGVKIQELDPKDNSVGYGGLPNEDGVVQLDASCMHGPTRRAGAVAALEGIRTPSEVARLVLRYTDHILLVGEGAKRFALSFGFKEEELLTPESRQRWLEWRANRGPHDDWLDVTPGAPLVGRPTGTINLNVVNARGEISSVTTTSGLAWKIPGRVGDSPIIGAGQYTDNDRSE